MREPFMNLSQRIAIAFALVMTIFASASIASEVLEAEVKAVYDSKLKELFSTSIKTLNSQPWNTRPRPG